MVNTNVAINVGKVKTYRGKSIDELKKLDVREFAKYLNSRERRTVLRSFQLIQKFLEKSRKDLLKNKLIKTQTREIPIVPEMIGWTIAVHNGKEYTQIKVTEEMLGHRLGEFTLTRKPVKHGAAGIGATKGSASQSVK